MTKYRKKPVIIDAVKFKGSSTHIAQIEEWMNGGNIPVDGGIHTRDIRSFTIPTLEGDHTASPGDYIIKGVKGEFYPCKPDIFEMTYDLVTD